MHRRTHLNHCRSVADGVTACFQPRRAPAVDGRGALVWLSWPVASKSKEPRGTEHSKCRGLSAGTFCRRTDRGCARGQPADNLPADGPQTYPRAVWTYPRAGGCFSCLRTVRGGMPADSPWACIRGPPVEMPAGRRSKEMPTDRRPLEKSVCDVSNLQEALFCCADIV